MSRKRVAVLGATGLVGREIIRVLEEQQFPVSELVPLASSRSAGSKISFHGKDVLVQEVSPEAFVGVDIALFSAGGGTSKKWAPIAAEKGAVVVDNSSAWRMDPQVPLVIPEVNGGDALLHKGIIANPNCATIQALVALYPLHQRAGLEYINVSTYQSVSGTGKEALEELKKGSVKLLAGESIEASSYAHPIAFELLPHIGSFDEEGISEEEWKMVNESRKIMHLPHLMVSGTTVRVPVFRGHGEAIVAQFKEPLSPQEARDILSRSLGVVVQDDPANALYPRPRDAAGRDAVFVGRIRRDTGLKNALAMWVVSDNLRKGAALNAVQIASLLL